MKVSFVLQGHHGQALTSVDKNRMSRNKKAGFKLSLLIFSVKAGLSHSNSTEKCRVARSPALVFVWQQEN